MAGVGEPVGEEGPVAARGERVGVEDRREGGGPPAQELLAQRALQGVAEAAWVSATRESRGTSKSSLALSSERSA